jgi:hypothetical protein
MRKFEKDLGLEFLSRVCSQYDFRGGDKAIIVKTAIELLIKMIKKDY